MSLIITISIFLILLFVIVLQRKTIFELESSIWQIENDYKKETGKIYRWNKSEIDKW
jgi:hypothetical protein